MGFFFGGGRLHGTDLGLLEKKDCDWEKYRERKDRWKKNL